MKKSCMDKNQFAKRLQEQKSKYYRMAYSYVKNEHDALDIIGEASYKGLKEPHTLKQPEYFDDNDFFECDNEIEIVEVENEPEAEEAAKEEPKKKAAPKKNNKKPAKADAE